MTDDVVEKVDRLADLDKQIKDLQKTQKKVKQDLVEIYMERCVADPNNEENGIFRGTNVVASVTEITSNRFDAQKFKIDNQNLYENYLYESKSVSVRLKNS